MALTDHRPSPVFDRTRRSVQSEILDGPVSTADLAEILRDLARFNGLMQGHWPVLRWLDRAFGREREERSLTILDVGCGYGDLLRAIRVWSRRRNRPVRLVGIDLSAQVIDVARSVTPPADDIEFHAADVFAFKPLGQVDFIVNSLMTHHLSDEMIVRFLRWTDATSQRGWMIYDLQRSIVPFYFIALAGPLLRLHPVVVYDGRISVARSLTRGEWRERILASGIPLAAIDLRWFMFRFAIGRLK